jgi:hypothetical protein
MPMEASVGEVAVRLGRKTCRQVARRAGAGRHTTGTRDVGKLRPAVQTILHNLRPEDRVRLSLRTCGAEPTVIVCGR